MISSKKYVDETLKKYNLCANKALGQNFLVESEIASYIVDSANIKNETLVIEIGPGMGALTEFALQKAKKVVAFEIDNNMVTILKDNFKNLSNFEVNNIDFLKVNIEDIIKQYNKEGYKDIVLLSNLPYYITSKLLNKILMNDLPIRNIVTMMQKEVGQKIVKPDKKDINELFVILSYQYDVSIVKYVGKNSYLPRPAIDSIVLKFEKCPPKYDVKLNDLLKVLESLFFARRKTIYNNLKNLFENIENVDNCLKKCNLSINLRVEQMTIQQIIDVCKYYSSTKD